MNPSAHPSARRSVSPERLVWILTVMAASGITAVIPVLPLYASGFGADVHFIGWMMASYWAANLVSLPLGGWLSDRYGRQPVLVAGLLGYALASAGFLILQDTWFFLLLRAIEGVAGACFLPAALAYVADRAPDERQGERIASLAAAENTGILLGPMIGGALATQFGLASPFTVLAVLCAFGALLALRLPESRTSREAAETPAAGVAPWAGLPWRLASGVAARALTAGFSMGLLEVVWPLFVTRMGGTVWHVSLSWTVFALPSLLLSRWVGRLIDRVGAGRPAVFGTAISACATVGYATAQDPWTIIVLSLLEGVGFAFAYPGLNALLVQLAPVALRGRVIGAMSTVRTIGAIAGALLTPSLYAISPALCFGVSAAVVTVGMILLGASLLKRPALVSDPAT